MSNYRKIKVALMSYAMDNREGKGTAIYARELIKNLLGDERFEFTLVHYEPVDDGLYAKADREAIMPPTFYPSRWLRQLKWFWQARRERFDIVHWFQPRLYPGYNFAPARFKIVTIHGGGEYYYPFFSISARMFDWMLRYFNRAIDLAIVGTESSLLEASDTYGLPHLKLAVTYYGGAENFKPIAKVEALAVVWEKYPQIKRDFILTVSRLQPHKNIGNLVKSYFELRDNSTVKPQLVIIAKPTEKYEDIYRLARESKYADDIIFIDYVPTEDLNYFYSAATVFAFPSLNEGFGLPVVEAMAAGTPVVVSNIPVLVEVAGGAAHLVNPYQPAEIAVAIERLLTDEGLREEKRRAGLERAKFFTWEKTAKETTEAYLKLFNHESKS